MLCFFFRLDSTEYQNSDGLSAIKIPHVCLAHTSLQWYQIHDINHKLKLISGMWTMYFSANENYRYIFFILFKCTKSNASNAKSKNNESLVEILLRVKSSFWRSASSVVHYPWTFQSYPLKIFRQLGQNIGTFIIDPMIKPVTLHVRIFRAISIKHSWSS